MLSEFVRGDVIVELVGDVEWVPGSMITNTGVPASAHIWAAATAELLGAIRSIEPVFHRLGEHLGIAVAEKPHHADIRVAGD